MFEKAEIITAVGALGCAVGIGFFMQSGELAEIRYGNGDLAELRETSVVGFAGPRPTRADYIAQSTLRPLDVKSIQLTSAKGQTITSSEPTDVLVKASVHMAPEEEADVGQLDALAQVAQTCPLTATAEQAAAAMVSYTLSAPCMAGSRVVINHSGLQFAKALSDEGTLELLVPALSKEAWITATFHDGETVDAVAWIDSVPLYDRVVVQWKGLSGLQVHAREFGAAYGEEGHVWSGAARDFSAISKGTGGFLTVLGDPSLNGPMSAEVYTFPTALSQSAGHVTLSVEAEVTADNCGDEISARAFQFDGGKRVSSQDLSLTVPDCEAIGNFLVLNNLLQDLTVAAK